MDFSGALTDYQQKTQASVFRTVGPGEVMIRVGAVGVSGCRLKLSGLDDPTVRADGSSTTFGNEIAGWVNQVGPGVHSVYNGEAVALLSVIGCGACRSCLRGDDNYCQKAHLGGILRNRGRDHLDPFLLVTDEHQLVPLPPNVSPMQAAPLLGAGVTALQAVEGAAVRLAADTTAVVIGAGAVGHLLVQALRATSATRVIAVDVRPESLELARRYGARETILASESLDRDLRTATGGGGADAVFDTVATDQTLVHAANCVATNGWIGIVGLGGGSLAVSIPALPFGVTVRSTVMGNRRNVDEALAMAARGTLSPETTAYSLTDAERAFDDVGRGAVVGCAVISVDPLYHFPD